MASLSLSSSLSPVHLIMLKILQPKGAHGQEEEEGGRVEGGGNRRGVAQDSKFSLLLQFLFPPLK